MRLLAIAMYILIGLGAANTTEAGSEPTYSQQAVAVALWPMALGVLLADAINARERD